MSGQYRLAMTDLTDGTFDSDHDTKFALGALLPATTRILAAGTKPSIKDLLDLRWIDSKRPGVYGCLASYTSSDGTIVYALKVGCAWSVDGGLKSRKLTHVNEKSSKEA